ncbi:MAG: CpsB/CapC family capsule biosynthesis tyrosine phosphatase [Oscillospiraceae bacterium]|nr:CpsB/CapC family capsule biosynthesis tyrosine phosphatase [Oscillospiraceae bacterium]
MLIDFHAHILPLADHGCDSADMTRKQMDMARTYGISAIVATPHFYPHRHTVEQFVERQMRGAALLRSVQRASDPQVILGAEVLACPGMARMERLEQLCIQGTDRVILLELPFDSISESVWDSVCALQNMEFHPVLAHLDRYSQQTVQRALNMGLPFQLNADAFRPPLRRREWKTLVMQDRVCALGSDLHGISEDAYRQYNRAVQFLGKYAESLMQHTEALLHGLNTV